MCHRLRSLCALLPVDGNADAAQLGKSERDGDDGGSVLMRRYVRYDMAVSICTTSPFPYPAGSVPRR